jgi:hypothetical protein
LGWLFLPQANCSCESWGDPNQEPRQFDDDGAVLWGRIKDPLTGKTIIVHRDVGLAQINLPTWSATAKKLGFDLFTYDGNLAMAKWIFDNDPRHEQNWKWSEGCWKR